MKYLVICVISAFLAINLSHESRGEILNAPFYFYYENGALLNVKVNLKNVPMGIDFRIRTWCSSIFHYDINKGRDFFTLESRLWCQETQVSIELFSQERSLYYRNITVLEGKIEDQSDGKIADQRFDNNDVCLYNVEPCIIELDLDRTNPDVNTAQSTRNLIPNTRATETSKHPTDLSYSEFESNFKTSPNSGTNVKSPPHYGNSAKTTPRYEYKPITTPRYGYKPINTPNYVNNAITTPHSGSNVTTTPHSGNNVATTPHYEIKPINTPNYGKKPITTPNYGKKAITTPHSGSNVPTTPHYGIKPITTPQSGKNVPTTPHYGIKSITTPHSGKNVPTTTHYGNNVITAPKHGNIATTTPHYGNKPITTPHSGNNVTTSPKHGNIATTTPQHEKSVTTSPDYGDNVKTKKLYENNGRTSEQTINDTNGTGEQWFSQTYIYVIVSIIGLCVVLFVTCILCTKKYCHRKKQQPVKTLELDTYVTANDVVYADLGLAQRSALPPRRDEESPYAQIIGVMRPDAKQK